MIYKQTFRCSELPRVLACPGSATLTAIVNPRQGDEGAEGTALHWQIASRICQELGGFGGERLTPTCTISVNKNSTWVSDFCFREVQEEAPADWALEVEVPLAYQFDRFILSGHIDALAINYDATECIGWDWKTGFIVVDPAMFNDQILGYMVLLLRAYPTLKKITFYIVQPRNDEDEGFERVSKVTIKGEALELCALSLEGRLNEALENPLLINSGRVQCHWCAAATQCPAIHAELNAMKLLLTPENLARIRAQADDATLADIVITSRMVAKPLEDAVTLLNERLDNKTELVASDGTKITRKKENGSYTVIDPMGLYRATRELIPDDAQYVMTIKPSMTQTKAMIAKVYDLKKTSKKGRSAQSEFDAKLRPFVSQGVRNTLIFSNA